jgi:hypothetical protein
MIRLSEKFLNDSHCSDELIQIAMVHNLGQYELDDLEFEGDYDDMVKRVVNNIESSTYDDYGNITNRFHGDIEVVWDYDNYDREVSYICCGTYAEITYDEKGVKTSITKINGQYFSTRKYNIKGQEIYYKDKYDLEQWNTYDDDGRKLSWRQSDGSYQNYNYRDDGLIESIVDDKNFNSQYRYCEGGLLREIVSGSNITTYEYDDMNNKISASKTSNGQSFVFEYWTYDENNNLSGYTNTRGDSYSNQNLPNGVVCQVVDKDQNVLLTIRHNPTNKETASRAVVCSQLERIFNDKTDSGYVGMYDGFHVIKVGDDYYAIKELERGQYLISCPEKNIEFKCNRYFFEI